VTAEVDSGVDRGERVKVGVAPEVLGSGLRAGDTVELMRVPPGHGAGATFSYFGTERSTGLAWMFLGFVVVVVIVARWRGVLALVGLGFSGVVVARFMLPALLEGKDAVLVALVGSIAIMFVVLYTTHGPSWRTTSALVGTLLGIGMTAGIGAVAVHGTRLTGIADEGGATLAAFNDRLSFQGLLICAVIVAGLGVLNDVTITQASAVWELRAAAPALSRRRLFAAALRIGRDHIASTIYTIVFAYVGTGLVVLLLLTTYDRPVLELLSAEQIAEELVRTLASATALVLAMPLTTLVATAMAAPRPAPAATAPLEVDWALETRPESESFEDFWGRSRRRPAGQRPSLAEHV
jgi:uncharacterized membrane protein